MWGTIASLGLVFAPFCLASQSSIQTRTSYNSERQQSYTIAGSWGFDERAFGNAAFTHARTPLGRFIGETDTFYQGVFGVGYAIDNLGFDLGFLTSSSPLTQTTTLGGYIGMTYIFSGEFADPKEYGEQTLDLLHSQIYEKKPEHPPIFWMRFGFAANSMRSDIVGDFNNSGKQTSFTVDGYYPMYDDLVLGGSLAFHGYDDSKGFFTNTQKNVTNIHVALLGATLQGLPKTSISVHAAWQLASRDTFTPRYSVTEIDASKRWSHTIDLGWRHQFNKHWFMTPTYEVSVQGARAFSGLIFELLYVL